ncbi:Vitamin B12 transporter BtuB (plasmid) [Asticcacaulis sp. MM231]|uniref:TonB-dependent receptor n=1 Tax=Asticcacaulis sp. MM231 TaxID=3157666 RepID=UPI0032D5A8D1
MRKTFTATLMSATALGSGVLTLGLLCGSAWAQEAAPDAKAAETGSTEVVIVSNRFTAKTMQLKSDNSISVLSAADLQRTAVHNAAEILGLMPGVNVMMTGNSFIGGIDGASRGEGQYVSIRSMNSEYNVNLINGVAVAQAQPYSRGVQLNLIPPSGLQTIVLNKTSTANMDGDAIGGTIDFRTPTAFDFKGKQRGSLSVSGNFESQADDLGADSTGYGAAADFSRKFGAEENFGVYVSAYYNLRHYANSELGGVMEASGGDRAYALSYVDANGNIPSGMDPIQDLILTGFNVGVSSGHTELWGGTVSLDWRPDVDTSYYMHLTYAHDWTTQNSSLNQIVGEGTVRNEGTSPLDADGNLKDGYIAVGNGLYQTTIPAVSNRLWYETNPLHSNLSTLDLGVKKRVGKWHFEPNVFYSFGRNDRPNHLEMWTTSIPAGSTSSGAAPYGAATLVTYGADNFPVAHLTPGMESTALNPGTMPAPCCYEVTSGLSQQEKYGARFDGGYDFDQRLLQSISFGAKYVTSNRDVSNRDYTVTDPDPASSLGADTAAIIGYYPGFPGKYDYLVPIVNHQVVAARYNALTDTQAKLDAASDICTGGGTALGVLTNYNCNTLSGTETVSAAYVMGKFATDTLEIIPGIRYELTDVKNTYWVRNFEPDPDDSTNVIEVPGEFQSNKASFTKVLPSVFLNYRPDAKTVYRASIWTSYTRPPMFQLGGSSSSKYDPSTGTTTITKGNPDLKAIDAVNFDANGTWRTSNGGYYGVGIFYKDLSNYIYDSGTGYINSATSGSGAVLISQPKNGGDASVLGIEFEGQQKFDGMPAPFNGLSIGGNLALQTSKADIGTSWGHDERMQNAPDVTANLGLYYAREKVTVDITYHYSGAYVANYDVLGKGGSWDNLWVDPVQHLDVHAGYDFGVVQLDLSIANLFKNYTYYSHIGEKSKAISDIIQSGRTALLTLKYAY